MNSTQTPAIAPGATWRLDPIHSSVRFEVDYLGGTLKVEIREVAARLTTIDEAASLEGVAKVASIDVKDDNLAGHLRSPDFFDAERYPELRFSANQIALDGEAVRVEGEITIKGVTQPLIAAGTAVPPVTDFKGNERIGLKVAARVDRREFGVSWNAPLPAGGQALSNDVQIVAELYFVKE